MIVEETVSSNQACQDGPLAVATPGRAVSMQPPREPFSLEEGVGHSSNLQPRTPQAP